MKKFPGIMNNQACIRGMRIPVSLLLNLLANGLEMTQILKEYPDLEKDDIQETLKYAAFLAEERIFAVA